MLDQVARLPSDPDWFWTTALLVAIFLGCLSLAFMTRANRRGNATYGHILALTAVGFIICGAAALFMIYVLHNSSARTPSSWSIINNNLTSLGRALESYQTAKGTLPDDIRDPQGNPLLSWRVALLPYVEQEKLFKQFNLNERWDGPNNIRLVKEIPYLYRPVVKKVDRGHTFLQVFWGPNTAFRRGKQRRLPADFPDGPEKTILVILGGEAVPWTKPADLAFDPVRSLPPLGGDSERLTFAVLGDGSVRGFVKERLRPERLRAWISADANDEALEPDK